MTTHVKDEFANRFAVALEARELSLDRVRAHLADVGYTVSVATLSYWRSGRSVPWRRQSLEMVAHLESLLRVPPGFLSEVVPSNRRPMWNPASAMPMREQAQAQIDELSGNLALQWQWLSIDDVLYVDGPGSGSRVDSRVILEAKADGANELPVVLYPDSLGDPAPAIDALDGCTINRLVQVSGTHITFATLQLPRPLVRGERAAISYSALFDGTAQRDQVLHRATRTPLEMLSLTVVFGEDQPTWAQAQAISPAGTAVPMTPATQIGNRICSINFTVPVGTYRLDWRWQTPDKSAAD